MNSKKTLCFLLVTVFTLSSILLFPGAITAADDFSIRVGSKQFPEQILLGEILIQLLEANNYTVDNYTGLGGTNVAHEALVNGEIDVYPEYTGTGLMDLLGEPLEADPQKAYDIVKESYMEKWNLAWMEPLGYESTWALVVPDDSEYYTISELAADENITINMYLEFLDREDGWPHLKEHYNFKITEDNIAVLETGIAFQELDRGNLDAAVDLSTEPLINRYNMRILEDDKQFFPPYEVAYVVREELLNKDPEIEMVINQLSGLITIERFLELLYEVSVNELPYENVAEDFLKAEGLI